MEEQREIIARTYRTKRSAVTNVERESKFARDAGLPCVVTWRKINGEYAVIWAHGPDCYRPDGTHR